MINYSCVQAGGPLYYAGRDMQSTHQGMNISESDWTKFLEHAGATLRALSVPQWECEKITAFVASLKTDIVEA